MNAALLVVLRYLVTYGCALLAAHGYSIANLDASTTDAVVQIAAGVLGAVAMAGIGVWTSMIDRVLARLKAHHKPALVAAAAEVVAADPNAAVK